MKDSEYRKNIVLTACASFLIGYVIVRYGDIACANANLYTCSPKTPSITPSISPSVTVSLMPSTSPTMSLEATPTAGASATPTSSPGATNTPIPQTQIGSAATATNTQGNNQTIPTSPPDTGHASQ